MVARPNLDDGTRLTYATSSGLHERKLGIGTAFLEGSAPSVVASHINDECCVDGGDLRGRLTVANRIETRDGWTE